MSRIFDNNFNKLIEQKKIDSIMSKKLEYNWISISFVHYWCVINIFKNKLNILYKYYNSVNYKNKILLEPVFFFKPQYFAKRTEFFDYLNKFKISGAPFFKKAIKKHDNFYKGNLFILTNYTSTEFLVDFLKKNDENKQLFFLKSFINEFSKNELFFLRNIFFNLHLNCVLDVYKITVLLLIKKLNKKYI